MKVFFYPEKSAWPAILERPVMDSSAVDSKVIPVIADVRDNGDIALVKYTEAFDGVRLTAIEVGQDIIRSAGEKIDKSLKAAIDIAVSNIEKFHMAQVSESRKIETSPGVICWQRSVPVERVGLYVPGGSAPLFSTVLMLAVPARIAGCPEIVLCTPPGKDGQVHPAILYAAAVTGVTRVFMAGGAQAIAAMAYGTETIPRVYKIFGPGNQYVMAAKQLVARDSVAIDMPAGPSEVMVVAGEGSRPAFVAADLLSQAEHGPDSQVILVATAGTIVEEVNAELEKQIQSLERKALAAKSIDNSRAIVLESDDDIVAVINEYAPEHLIISTQNADALAERVVNAGSVFIGNYAPESAGDYISGTNHTLPTNGYAKMYNGVNLDDFVKKITFQNITEEGLKKIGPAVITMAEAENLGAHSNAVRVRI